MYISVMTMVIVGWVALVGAFLGLMISRGKGNGTIVGTIAALAVGCLTAVVYQNSEISSWQYDDVGYQRDEDCRVAPYVKSILGDKTITKAEYWGLQDLVSDLRLRDARGRANDEAKRQCPSS